MPVYVVSHQFELTENQRSTLAQAITRIHSTIFTTPSLFVNVHFRPTDQFIAYVGGKKRTTNSITGIVRHNNSRTQQQYALLCNEIGQAWKDAIGVDNHVASGSKEKQLGSIFIQGEILAGWEQGIMIPEAGNDKQWLQEHWSEIKKKAEVGDEDMKELVEDIEKRKLIS